MAKELETKQLSERDQSASMDRALRLHAAGEIAEAEVTYRKLIALNPNHPEALHYLGVIAFQVGQNEAAEDFIRKALSVRPDYVEAHTNLGLVLKKQNKPDEAIASFQTAISIKSNHAAAHFNLANLWESLNQDQQAIASYEQLIFHNPDHAEGYYNLGRVYEKIDHLEQAIVAYKAAISARPDYGEALNNLGRVFLNQNKLEEAADSFGKGIAALPEMESTHVNLGIALKRLGNLTAAEQAARQAIAVNPDYADAYNSLGVILREQFQFEEADACYRKAIALRPDYDEAHYNLANLLKELNQLDAAVESYRQAINHKPGFAEAHYNLGTTLQEIGDFDGASAELDKALVICPEKNGWRIRKVLLLPVIYDSLSDIDVRRVQLEDHITHLHDQNLSVGSPDTEIGSANFFLAYQNRDDRRLMESIAALHRKSCPSLVYTAPHCLSPKDKPADRLRVGVLSSFFYSHTISNLVQGFIDQFSRNRFEVIVLGVPGKKDQVTQTLEKAADRFIVLRKNLDQDRKFIAGLELDILFYPEIGMDPYTYFLSQARLAPVQAVTWGHPDTTGIPNMDYFISSALLEPSGAEDHYNEKLVRLSLLPTCYDRPEVPDRKFNRSDFGLPEKAALYLCPQTLFKFHPDFDAVLAALLSKDLEGRLVLIDDGKGGHWRRLLQQRFSRSYPDLADLIVFVPKMDKQKFLSLLILADAVLDIPSFSGGNSSLEAFAMGVPIVTWPGSFMRSRVTAGCYRQMGLQDLIASDADDYVSLAIMLAHDTEFKARVKADIAAHSDKLFHRTEVVRELESVFIDAHQKIQGTFAAGHR